MQPSTSPRAFSQVLSKVYGVIKHRDCKKIRMKITRYIMQLYYNIEMNALYNRTKYIFVIGALYSSPIANVFVY